MDSSKHKQTDKHKKKNQKPKLFRAELTLGSQLFKGCAKECKGCTAEEGVEFDRTHTNYLFNYLILIISLSRKISCLYIGIATHLILPTRRKKYE